MVDSDLGQQRTNPWGGVILVLACTGAFLVVAGCAAYFIINLMA
jgi:hypothetical protein